MPTEADRVGISAYHLRLAAYYAAQGIGTYHPKGYSWFDRVEVYIESHWTADKEPEKSMQVLRVEFYDAHVRLRYIEFGMVLAGFGGVPVLKLVTSKTRSKLPPLPPRQE